MRFPQALGFLSLLAVLALLWQIRKLLLLLFAAIVVANGLNHLAQWFQKQGLQRGQSILAALGLFGSGLILAVALIIPPFLTQLQQVFTLAPQGADQFLRELRNGAARLDPALLELLPNSSQWGTQLQPWVNQLAGQGLTVFYATLGLPLGALLLLALSLMLLADPQAYRQGFIRFFPALYRPRAALILNRCEADLESWLKTILLDFLSITLLSFAALSLLQVRLPLAQALLAGLLTLIPTIGPLLSVFPPAAIALLDSPWKALGVLIAYAVIYQADGRLLAPRLLGRRSLPLLRGVLLLAQLFLASCFGLFGLILAVPLALTARVLIQEALIGDILDRWTTP
ncbi:MAG: AI-2E family transporter [Cyanobacteria bacterium RI_101]|nr:AI-2E family transporter [Cyanobacteria bacterium RI_101]